MNPIYRYLDAAADMARFLFACACIVFVALLVVGGLLKWSGYDPHAVERGRVATCEARKGDAVYDRGGSFVQCIVRHK